MSCRHIQNAAVTAVLFTLTACETLAPQEPASLKNSDHVVVPGERIGPVYLGMSPKNVFQLLGSPSTTKASTLVWTYGDSTLFVRADDTHQRVVQIAIYNDVSFHTAEGARYGSTLQDLDRIWGPPYKLESYSSWPNRGGPIQAGFDQGKIVFFFEPPAGELDTPPKNGAAVLSIQLTWEDALSF